MQCSECSTRGRAQWGGPNFQNHGLPNWVWKPGPQFYSSLISAVVSCTWAILRICSQSVISHQKTWKTEHFGVFFPLWSGDISEILKTLGGWDTISWYPMVSGPPCRNYNTCNGHISSCVMGPSAAVTWSSGHKPRSRRQRVFFQGTFLLIWQNAIGFLWGTVSYQQ